MQRHESRSRRRDQCTRPLRASPTSTSTSSRPRKSASDRDASTGTESRRKSSVEFSSKRACGKNGRRRAGYVRIHAKERCAIDDEDLVNA